MRPGATYDGGVSRREGGVVELAEGGRGRMRGEEEGGGKDDGLGEWWGDGMGSMIEKYSTRRWMCRGVMKSWG